MRDPQYGKGKFTSFLTGKGFYAILAICLVGAGVAAWGAADRTLNNIQENNNELVEQSSQKEDLSWTFPEPQEAGKTNTEIPKSSTPSSSSLPQSSSSTPQEEPTSPSEQPVMSPKPQTSAFAWPVKGDVLMKFSGGELVKNETLKVWRTHDGVDIAAEKGAKVTAAGAGKVLDVREDPLWGTVVEIEHSGGIISMTAGIDKDVKVKKGDTVKKGQQLGVVGLVPAEQRSPSHIHFAMKQKEQWIDPQSVIK